MTATRLLVIGCLSLAIGSPAFSVNRDSVPSQNFEGKPLAIRENHTNLQQEESLQLAAALSDGSLLIGTPSVKVFRLDTSFAKLKVPLKLVSDITFEKDHEHVGVKFKNGDELHGVIDLGAIRLMTAFGPVSLPVGHLERISVSRMGSGLVIIHL